MTTKLQHNEYGRYAKLPGAETTIRINTAAIPVRTRNALIDALETGIVPFGWSSKAKQLADALTQGRDAPLVLSPATGDYTYTHFDGITPPAQALPHLEELVRADLLAVSVDGESYWGGQRLGDVRRRVSENLEALRGGKYKALFIHSPEMRRQVAAALAGCIPEDARQRAKELAERVRAGETITVAGA